jgi:hypothetical protein
MRNARSFSNFKPRIYFLNNLCRILQRLFAKRFSSSRKIFFGFDLE